MKRALTLAAIAAVIALAFIGCADSSGSVSVPYFVGYTGSQPAATPCYWHEGTIQTLPTDSSYSYGSAWATTTSGSSVYIAGTLNTDSSSSDAPCYWKDGSLQILDVTGTLTNGSGEEETISYGSAGGIAVLNGHLYVSAWVQSGGGNYYPYLWTDDVGERLSAPTDLTGVVYGDAYKAMALNGSLYIAGDFNSGESYYPCYWKDDVCFTLKVNDELTVGSAYAVAMADGVVYVGGYASNCPYYWKDGIATQLKDTSGVAGYGCVEDIDASGSTAYCVGYITDSSLELSVPCVWVNGACTVLSYPSGSTYGEATTVVVSNGVVYIGGYTEDSSSNFIPCCWVDGVYSALPLGDATTGELWGARGIGGSLK